jgi:uncharacterized membrane protein
MVRQIPPRLEKAIEPNRVWRMLGGLEDARNRFLSETNPNDLQSDDLWFLGCLMELIGTLGSVCGKQFFRHAALSGRKSSYVYGGLLVVFFYPLCNIIALEFAAQTVISTVTGMVVVWNILLAPCTLREDMTTKRMTTAVVVMIGIVGAGSFGAHYEVERDPDAELVQLSNPAAISYYVMLAAMFTMGYGVLLREKQPAWMPRWATMPQGSMRQGALQGFLAGAINGNAFVLKAALVFVRYGEWGNVMTYCASSPDPKTPASCVQPRMCMCAVAKENGGRLLAPTCPALSISARLA